MLYAFTYRKEERVMTLLKSKLTEHLSRLLQIRIIGVSTEKQSIF